MRRTIVLDDEELGVFVRCAVADSETMSAFLYRMRGYGYEIGQPRLERVWQANGGEIRSYVRG